MTTRLVAFLFAATVFGAAALVAIATRQPKHIARIQELAPSRASIRPIATRLAVLLLAATIFGGGSYIGLDGDSGITSSVATQVDSSMSREQKLSALVLEDRGDSLASVDRSARVAAAHPSPPAAPTPAPVPETPAPTAVPAPVPTAVPTPAVAAVAEQPAGTFESMICAMPWPCGEAVSVASCESGLDRNGFLDGNWATNGNNYGLFQINSIHSGRWPDFFDNWMDPSRNIQFAFEIWSESGWRPWHCQPH